MNSAPSRPNHDNAADADSVDGDALEVVLASASERKPRPRSTIDATCGPAGAVVVAELVELADDGQPIVQWTDGSVERRRSARSIVPLDRSRIGAEVALTFPVGRSQQPLILGILTQTDAPPAPLPRYAKIDDERLELSADRELVLRCGKASITLTRAGKVIIRGAYLLSRSSGVNRIKGGSVQIN